MPLGKLDVFTGMTPSKKKQSYYGNEYPFYKPGDFNHAVSISTAAEYLSEEGYNHTRQVPESSTLVTCIGATTGKVAFASSRGSCNQQINVIPPSEKIDPRYVFFVMTSDAVQSQLQMSKTDSSMPMVSLSKFKGINIPVPSLEEQERIASILDKFDTLVNDISQGLPAEINARRNQYEYYRNKLLTFKEKAA